MTPPQGYGQTLFTPNFEGECHVCGTSPTVRVEGHAVPETDLCGPHFFNDPSMIDWEQWNDPQED